MGRDENHDIDLDGAPDTPFPEARVSVSRDRMTVLLDAEPIPHDLDAFIPWVLAQLAQQQIRPDLRDDRIGERIRAAASEDAWRGLVLPKANAPASLSTVHRMGRRLFQIRVRAHEETGALNYRKPAAERNVQTELLATVHPQPGEAPTSTEPRFWKERPRRVLRAAGTSARKRILFRPRRRIT